MIRSGIFRSASLYKASIYNASIYNAIRFIHLHEYQSKHLLRTFGLNVQKGDVADNIDNSFKIANELKLKENVQEFVVKSQILAGGRGKGRLTSGLEGGIQICKDPQDVKNISKKMLGHRLITSQTTNQGEVVHKVLILESVNISKELYLAILLDASAGGIVIVASKKGGVDIEEVAKKDPQAVIKIPIKDSTKITREECKAAAEALGLTDRKYSFNLNVTDQIERLFNFFIKTDATIVEINPLAITTKCGDHLVCVDAKLNFDDNAAYRQKEIMNMEDRNNLDPRERAAQNAGLNFVSMEGKIGCLVNGAGLAMATMDIIKLYGGDPANFLDVGGGANTLQVIEAFKIISLDKNVKAIFVNIFGGIMRCDIIAEGLISAIKATNLKIPLVVRLIGNQVNEGKNILKNKSKLPILVIDDLDAAARAACKLAI